jgi:hypoxanthine phosphoribosyltransferase
MPDLARAWAYLEQSDLVASADEVQVAIARVAAELHAKFSQRYPLVLAVMGGAVVFAGQLLPRLRFPLDFDYIHATRYGDRTRGQSVDWRVTPGEQVRGRHVLVLDDILDAGQTMCAIRDQLLATGAASFACAVLVEKTLPQPKPLEPDFVGLRVPDRFVFGCGMDAEGYWRNLPEIRALRSA